MQQKTTVDEVLVSETGALIPAETLRAAGIKPGDRLTVMRTTQGTLVVIPQTSATAHPSLRPLVGIAPRPAGMSREDDQEFLRAIRWGDED